MNPESNFHQNNSKPPPKTGSLDDEVLWANLKVGNELAFSMQYKRYVNRLYNYGVHGFKDCDLIKDCLQELFARLWSKRETLGVAGSVSYYLFKSVCPSYSINSLIGEIPI